MRKLAVLSLVLLAAALVPAANASPIHVLATNFDDYGQGMVCVVDGASNGAFETLFHAADFNTSRTDRNSAVKLLGFLQDSNHGDCYRLPASGQGAVDAPDRSEVYIVTVLMTPSGSNVYWNITNVDGSIEQVVTIP